MRERDAKRLVNATCLSYTILQQAHRPTPEALNYTKCVACVVATRKNISIRDDQEEWIQENHLNLSSFVQEKLDELIEERS